MEQPCKAFNSVPPIFEIMSYRLGNLLYPLDCLVAPRNTLRNPTVSNIDVFSVVVVVVIPRHGRAH